MAKTLPKVLSRQDALRLVTAPETMTARARRGQLSTEALRNRVVLELLYRCGLRESEVCNLTPADVLIERRWLRVQKGKGKKDRDVPMSRDTAEWCRKWMERRDAGEWFVTTSKGTQVQTSHLRRLLRRMSQELGILVQDGTRSKPVQPHVLRHSYATHSLKNGVNVVYVQQMLGHASLQTTQVYLHVMPDDLQEAMDHAEARALGEVAQNAHDAT